MTEVFREITGYEGFYQVSNLGNVRSVERTANVRFGKRVIKGCILKQKTNTYGYLFVSLSKENKVKHHLIHRLVAQAFIPNPDNLPEINHKDENITNNNVNNLEWCNRSYNINYGTRNTRCAKTQLNRCDISKPVLCIETGIVYPSACEAARSLNICKTSIRKCCNGLYTKAGGYHWKSIKKGS